MQELSRVTRLSDMLVSLLLLSRWNSFYPSLQALSKTLTADELYYLREQFALLEPNKNGTISLDNIKTVGASQIVLTMVCLNQNLVSPSVVWQALKKNATDAMNESRIFDFLASVSSRWDLASVFMSTNNYKFLLLNVCFSINDQLNALQYRRMDFEEFCAAALSVYQLEALDRWEQHARCAYELFDKDGNRTIMIEELASVKYTLPRHILSPHSGERSIKPILTSFCCRSLGSALQFQFMLFFTTGSDTPTGSWASSGLWSYCTASPAGLSQRLTRTSESQHNTAQHNARTTLILPALCQRLISSERFKIPAWGSSFWRGDGELRSAGTEEEEETTKAVVQAL